MISLLTKTIKLQTLVEVDADDGAPTSTWTTQAQLRARIHGRGKGRDMAYDRDGIAREVTLLVMDALPKLVFGHSKLSSLLNAPDTNRVRFLVGNRTLTFESMAGDGSGVGGPPVLELTCIETPQPIGYVDK